MYDIAVYLPGGAVALVLGEKAFGSWLGIDGIYGDANSAVAQIITGVVWLSASYLVGHILAFASAYVVENFLYYKLGSPSDVWLKSEQHLRRGKHRRHIFRAIFSRSLKEYPNFFGPRFIRFLQLPAILPLYAARCLQVFGFYIHKLPHGILPEIRNKFRKLGTSVEIAEDTRWDKILTHYVANEIPTAYSRMYNYLVIYGALRMLALLVLLSLWYLLIFDLVTKFSQIGAGYSIDWSATFVFNALSAVYVVCLMAFGKFNRRFFEESVLAFLVSK